MWPFKKKNKDKVEVPTEKPISPQNNAQSEEEGQDWIPVGEGNPFDAPVLDIRSVALNMVSTTKDQSVAENYSSSRSCDGKKYINQQPENSQSFLTNFSYPHNGEALEGIVFKSPVMEVKWDIYAYGEWFYFVRSWTSELVYKVRYENAGNELIFKEVLASNSSSELDAQNIHSIMLTHVLGRVWPYHVPEDMRELPFKTLALQMFSQFGSKATILTTGNVFEIGLAKK